LSIEVEDDEVVGDSDQQPKIMSESRILEPEGGVITDLPTTKGFRSAFNRSIRSPYLLANLVYFAYTCIIIDVDLNPNYPIERINGEYLGANIIHLCNAMLYIWVWIHEGFSITSVIMIPEFLNIMEASLYISSSTYYPLETYEWVSVYPTFNGTVNYNSDNVNYTWVNDPITSDVQNIEITASIIELFASFGWCITWYMTFQRVPGRGFTLDDPDIWANLSIVLGALMYLTYNCQIIADRTTYGTNLFYVTADWVYFFNSICYVTCALRDAGWFWFMPVGGRPNFNEKFVKVVKEMPPNKGKKT